MMPEREQQKKIGSSKNNKTKNIGKRKRVEVIVCSFLVVSMRHTNTAEQKKMNTRTKKVIE